MKHFDIEKQDYENSVTVDWLRLSIAARLFDVFAGWLNIPTDPAQWSELKRFNKEFGCYLMDGVSVWAEALPVGDGDIPASENWEFAGKRIVIDFSGSGLANWFKEQGDTPLDIIRYANEIEPIGGDGDGVRINRLDLAFDDHSGYLDLDKIQRYLTKTDLTVTRWEKFERVSASQIRGQGDAEPEDTGETLYLGSRASNSFARIYNKLLEIKSKLNREARRAVEKEDALPEHWIRFELELKRDHAQEVALGLLRAGNEGARSEYALGVLRGKIDFKATTGDARIRRREPVRWWERFTRACAAVPIRIPRPALTLERIAAWVDHTVAPSLAVLYLAAGGGETGQTEIMKAVARGRGRLDEKKLGLLRGVEQSPPLVLFTGHTANGMAHSS